LISQNHDANEFGGPNSYPLFAALENGNLGVAESLLLKGGNINIQDQIREDTAMHRAIAKGDEVVAKFLMDQNADLTVCNLHGHATLHQAVKTFCVQRNDWDQELIKMLAIVNVNVKDKRGKTAVHLAANLGCVPSVSVLMHQRADVNMIDDDGRTALHVASCLGNVEIVDMLLNNQASIRISDHLGYTALHLAVQSGNTEIIANISQKLEDPLYPSNCITQIV